LEPVACRRQFGDTRFFCVEGLTPGEVPPQLADDPLTLSASLRLPFVDFSLERVALREDGTMHLAAEGRPAFVSRWAGYDAFMRWVEAGLEGTPAAPR
jgi:hypothetical protein